MVLFIKGSINNQIDWKRKAGVVNRLISFAQGNRILLSAFGVLFRSYTNMLKLTLRKKHTQGLTDFRKSNYIFLIILLTNLWIVFTREIILIKPNTSRYIYSITIT